jgi:plasmid rolling circle replication initiator protein Rep
MDVELTEAELIYRIAQTLPESFWQRYAELRHKLKAETITKAEHQELITLSDEKEAHDVERLRNLIELSKRRKTPLETLMQELDIRPRTLAT